uniref:Secreted protein n=1 Tax=Syphacia muris TaxID=451379 RepID=A0A0N5AB84_9BILA
MCKSLLLIVALAVISEECYTQYAYPYGFYGGFGMPDSFGYYPYPFGYGGILGSYGYDPYMPYGIGFGGFADYPGFSPLNGISPLGGTMNGAATRMINNGNTYGGYGMFNKGSSNNNKRFNTDGLSGSNNGLSMLSGTNDILSQTFGGFGSRNGILSNKWDARKAKKN